jgi:glycosyltransferase involved in cell wall biosynthesis
MLKKTLKVDLHVHSKYSTRPSEWILRKIGCSESYTEPKELYALARDRGMDLVTITDHNNLSGSLEIAHLENTFVSEEITTYFPEDRCKLHVLAYDINESQHEDIKRFRENVFDLVAYLNKEKIIHALAHPLFAINDMLTVEHVEKALLLFKIFEVNGTRISEQNQVLRKILQELTREDVERLSNKHALQPLHREPWKKTVIGGSDDHSSLNIACNYTEMEGVSTVDEFLAGIGQKDVRVNGRFYDPKTMAHTICSVAYQFYKTRFSLDSYLGRELLLRFTDHALIPSLREEEGFVERIRNVMGYRRPNRFFKQAPETMQGLLQKEAREIILSNPPMNRLLHKPKCDPREMEEQWFTFVNQISEKIIQRFVDTILESLSGANLFDIFHTIGSVGSIYTMLAPYFVSYALYKKERQFSRRCREYFDREKPVTVKESVKIAHFTDTFYEVNGVALTLRKNLEMSLKNNKQQTIITCGPNLKQSGVTNFTPIGTYELPEYPELKLYYPPLLEMIDYCYEENFTHIHSATPGPIGLAALVIARILRLPFNGTYHTALPQYAMHLTGDSAMEEMMWKYVLWYYNQMDMVYVPSMATGNELIDKGIPESKIRFYDRGIDIDRFNPSKRNGFFQNRYKISKKDLKFLYVGRISREKNLPFLAEVFKTLIRLRPNLHLVIVGDGPYLKEMKASMKELPVTFTGYLEGDDLPQAYASSDVFVFPSTTDTFGNVVLEAQASGLPVIVTDEGGPQENIRKNETGFIVRAGNVEAFIDPILKLIDDPDLLHTIRGKARSYMEDRSLEAAFLRLWETYGLDDSENRSWGLYQGSKKMSSSFPYHERRLKN